MYLPGDRLVRGAYAFLPGDEHPLRSRKAGCGEMSGDKAPGLSRRRICGLRMTPELDIPSPETLECVGRMYHVQVQEIVNYPDTVVCSPEPFGAVRI